MSAYSGRYYRGASRDRKIQKREEAEARQAAFAEKRPKAQEALAAFAELERAAYAAAGSMLAFGKAYTA